jgi:hypothetical protein
VAAAGPPPARSRPLTFSAIGQALAERWPRTPPAALAHVVRTRVPLVQVPPRGLWGESGQAVHTSAELWLGRPVGPALPLDELVLRYLAAFGPASVRDVATWSGLTRLREVVERLRPRLRVFRDEGGVELFDLPDAPRPDGDTAVPVRFMPEWDNLLLSHQDRGRIIADEHRARVFSFNGIIAATLLVDGFVRGTWRIERARGSATLRVELFGPIPRADRDAVAEEGARLLDFAAAGARHDVRVAPAGGSSRK